MTDLKGIQLPISIDASTFKHNMSELNGLMKTFQSQLKSLQSIKTFDTQSDKIKITQKALENYERQLQELNAERSRMEQNGTATDTTAWINNTKAIEKVKEGITDAKDALEALNAKTEESKGVFNDLGQADMSAVSAQIDSMTIAMGNLISRGIRRAIQGIKELASSVVSTGETMDSNVGTLKALFGDAVDDAGMQQIIDKARELGTTTAYSATEITQSMKFFALAGYSASETVNAIGSALNLASASGEEFDTVANILVDGLKAFGTTATESNVTAFADALAQTAVSTNVDVADLGESLKYAGSVSGMFGYSIKDVSMALGIMAEQGVKGSMAGTALRQTMLRLGNNTSGARDTLEALGVSFFDTEGNANDLMSVLEGLRNALRGQSNEMQVSTLTTIGGARAVTGLTAIVNASETEWNKLRTAIAGCAGATESIAQTRLDNFAGDVLKLQNNWEEVKLQLYDSIVPALRTATQELTKFLKSGDFKTFIKNVGNIADSLLTGLIGALKFVVEHFDVVIATVKAFGVVLAGIKLESTITKFRKFIDGIKGTSAILGGLSTSLASLQGILGIVALAVGAVTTLVSLFDDAWKKQNSDLILTGENLKQFAGDIESAQDTYKSSIESIVKDNTGFETLTSQLSKYVNANGEIKEGKEAIVEQILGELSNAYGVEADVVDGVIQQYELYRQKLEEVMIEKQSMAIFDAQTDKVTAYRQTLADANDELTSLFSTMHNDKSVSDWVNIAFEKMNSSAKKNGEEVYSTLEEYLGAGGSYDELFGNIAFMNDHMLDMKFFKSIADDLDSGKATLDEANSYIVQYESNMNGYAEASQALADGNSALMQQWIENNGIVTQAISDMPLQEQADEIKNAWQTLYDTSLASESDSSFQSVADKASQVMSDILSNTTLTAPQIKSAIQDFMSTNNLDFQQLPAEMQNLYRGIVQTAETELSSVDLTPIGMNTANSFRNGIHSAMEADATTTGGTLLGGLLGNDVALLEAQQKGTDTGNAYVQGNATSISSSTAVSSAVVTMSSTADSANTLTEANGFSKGLNYAQGIINGLMSKMNEIKSVTSKMANTANSTIANVWDINSPSKVAYGFGAFYTQGLLNAFSDATPAIQSATSDIAGAVNNGMIDAQTAMVEGSSAISDLNVQTNMTSMFENAMKNVNLVVNNSVDMDGRQVANRISKIQGLELKKAGV